MMSVVDLDKDLAFVSVGAAAPLEGERTHFTCGRTRGISYGEEKFPLRVFNKSTSVFPKNSLP